MKKKFLTAINLLSKLHNIVSKLSGHQAATSLILLHNNFVFCFEVLSPGHTKPANMSASCQCIMLHW